ncbi:MAG: roadblock/LC7 domain-containing protein [Planctomycetes bacterium]|nr:roadblock/LC7 domain-containing protein [Planctomycetota bacterium]
MKAILEDLNQRLGARGSLVVTRDGLPVCAVLGTATPNDRLDRLAAMGAAILSDVRRSLAAAGLDEFTQCEVAAEQGKVVLVAAGPTYLVVLVGPRIEIGPGSVEIRSAARQIEKAAVLATA